MNAERDRDQAMDKLLRRTLRADAAAQASAACLDAETIAAWMDEGLDAHALAMAEAHVAGCARCQAIAGVMVRTTAATPAPARWWQRDWGGMRWLVPLAAGAAAVALWMVVPEQRQPAMPTIQETPAQARADAPAPGTVEAVAPAASPPVRPSEAKQAPAAKPQAAPSIIALNKEVAAAPSEARSALKLESPPIAAEAPARRAEARAASAPTPPPATSPAAALDRARQQRFNQDAATQEIVSPDPAARWRLGAGGAVEYSTNGGSAWESLSTGIAAELTAGASPSPTVCWLVGQGGIILLTTDGRRWQRVPFPEAADLSSVEATDARTAVVTAADGRVFRTSDAGQTWRPLQGLLPAPF